MSVAKGPEFSVRVERAETSRLAWAFAISLLLHLMIFGTWEAGKKYGWWQNFHWPAWLQTPKMLTELLKKKEPPREPPRELPLVFLDVSPAQATPEPPKDPKFYSDKNSQAANPEPAADLTTPKINGEQTQMVKTEDIPREKLFPLQPSPPLVQPQEPQEEQKKASPTQPPGDLALAKPEPTPRPDEGQSQDKPARPRTLQEALALPKNQHLLAGQKMKQEGGVRRRLEIASLDAKATSVGAYDRALVEAIQDCWYGLLDEQKYASDFRGKVVLQFQLHHDGSITDLSVMENSAGEIPGLICQTAVDKPRPFEKFPADMRRMVGDIRTIQFTFYYN